MISSIAARIEKVAIRSASRSEIENLLGDTATIAAWAEAVRAKCARRLTELAQNESIIPELLIARASRVSAREADRVVQRATDLAFVPALERALEQGEVSVAHVDVVTRAMARLSEEARSEFVNRSAHLVGVAKVATPEQLDKSVKRLVQSIEQDDGLARFERQRRATFLRHWTDRESGMVCLRGEFDPESGLQIIGRLERVVERLFHSVVPDTCPTDERKNDHLRALAFLSIVDENSSDGADDPPASTTASTSSRDRKVVDMTTRQPSVEVCVVVDLETLINGLHEHSIIDAGHGVDLPVDTIRRMACVAGIVPIVLDGNGVAIDVGRQKRLANRAQRRALRSMYPTCAVPWCHVQFEHTVPHHLKPWEAGGTTDLVNLLPLCSQHHHAAHEGGWKISVDPLTRLLTICLPDGALSSHPPPRSRAA